MFEDMALMLSLFSEVEVIDSNDFGGVGFSISDNK
jgi:hypothetical protein